MAFDTKVATGCYLETFICGMALKQRAYKTLMDGETRKLVSLAWTDFIAKL